MKVLIIGGMHGNEPLGIDLVNSFQKNPIANVDAIYANEQAIKANKRFIDEDLNRSFPGDPNKNDYVNGRAVDILKQTKKYDVVLDFHNTHCPDNDCGFVGENSSQDLLDVVWLLGLKRIVVPDYDCINKYATNCISVEISLSSERNQVKLWYELISLLAKINEFKVKPQIEKYRFVYRMTIQDKERLGLANKNFKAFKPMPDNLAKAMKLKTPAYPIFIGDGYTPYNFGGILNKLD